MRYYSVHTFMGNINRIGQSGVGAMQHAGYQLNTLTAQAGFTKPEVDIKYAANGRARELRRSSLSVKHETINPKPILDPLPRPIRPNEEHTITGIKDLIPKPKQPTIRNITDYTDHKWHVTFGPAGQRIRSVEDSTRIISIEVNDGLSEPIKINKNYTATRYYATNHEREIANGKTTDYTYIQSPNGLVAAIKTNGAQHDAMLIATDHLGSIIGVWNAIGTLLEEYRYSAWGLRTSSTANPRLRRGFTGHEHLAQFGLIDMQARLYDPHLGRFLAPDPYVQAPSMSMNFNRYAYCMNNPLKYTDPTGEKWWHWALGDLLTGGLLSTTALLTAEVATTTIITTGLTSYMTMFPFSDAAYEIQKLTSPIAIKFNFGIGSQTHIGVDASFGLPNYRWNCGATYYSNNAYGNESGWETRTGAEFEIVPFVKISGTEYRGNGFDQTTNRITLGGPFTNVSYENDMLFGLGKVLGKYNADEGDRWRSAAVKINAGPLSIGLNMFTGDPGLNEDDRFANTATINGHETYMGGTANDEKLRAGVLYLGIGSVKIGRNSEQIRKVFQNQFAHDFIMRGKAKWFQVLPITPTWFFYFGTGGSTLW